MKTQPKPSLAPQQIAAVDAVLAWHRSDAAPTKPFRLFGYAGSGKTTIAKAIADRIDGLAVFVAFTGKAASVLTSKGCPATTIHRLIYDPESVRDEQGKVVGVNFSFHNRAARGYAEIALVVVDECSMVGSKIGRDLEQLRLPVLALGDPAQLPPITEAGHYVDPALGQPDVMLTEIHRQREGCGILDIATSVRSGDGMAIGIYEESKVIPSWEIDTVDPRDYDIVLVGKNKTRQMWNQLIRSKHGRRSPLPEPGDQLVCLRNNARADIANGDLVTCTMDPVILNEDQIELAFHRGDSDREERRTVSRHYFEGRDGSPEWEIGDKTLYFDFGHALTVHKAQGSQWPRVLLLNESKVFGKDAARWLYTGITRASEHVTVVGNGGR